MTNQSSEETTNKKSMFIGFAIGFVIAFAISWFYFSGSSTAKNSIENQIPASELMKQEAATKSAPPATTMSSPDPSPVVAVAPAPAVKVESAVSKPTYAATDKRASQLIDDLFSDSETGRKQAKKALAKQFYDNPSVMQQLIEKCSNEFDEKDRNDNGIFQGIDVFLMVSEESPETLRQHQKALYAFFEKTKGQYRERTQARIEKVKRGLGGY